MAFWFRGLGVEAWGFKAQGLLFRVWDSRFRVPGITSSRRQAGAKRAPARRLVNTECMSTPLAFAGLGFPCFLIVLVFMQAGISHTIGFSWCLFAGGRGGGSYKTRVFTVFVRMCQLVQE